LVALAGGWAYVAVGGRLIAGAPLRTAEIPGVILPLILLTFVSFTVNSSLVAAVVSLSSGRSLLEVWKSSFTWTIPAESALAVLALALAQVVASEGIVGLGLFVVPLIIAGQFYERYVALRRTYADTVRSLVAVIEAKDSYTKGHSERVACYSVDIGRRLGFSDRRVERIELAALLHDLGKVAISRNILLKKSPLDDDEYEAIRSHPDIGAHIIESVPFLADLVQVILSHHERVDGAGYGSQLTGEQIPLEARVLSVADAFDAMTSSRPYRAAMSRDSTVRELRRNAGQQFDQVIVETFAEALANGAFPEDPSLAEVADEAV
jgi:putative nucleotidyltransferase with HDIG domain